MKNRQSRRKDALSDVILEMVDRLVERFEPHQIILFGSHARGTAGSGSDVDLLAVMPFPIEAKREKQLEVRLALRDVEVSKDVIVTTPEEFAWRKDIPGTVERAAAREGRVVYDRR